MKKSTTTDKENKTLNRGYFIGIVGALIWSSTAVFIRYLTTTYAMPALVLAFWRDFIVGVVLFIVIKITNTGQILRIDKKHTSFLILYGFVLSLFNTLWTYSVTFNGAAVSTVLVYTSSAFTALLGWWFLHERVTIIKIFAILLSITGCAFVAGAHLPSTWQVNILGIVTGLVSGIGFAVYSLLGKSLTPRNINPWAGLMVSFFIAAIFLLLYQVVPALILKEVPLPELFMLGNQWRGWLFLFLLAVIPTIGGYGLYTVSMGYLPASVANLIASSEPAFTAILAFFFLGEMFTPVQLLGSLAIMTSVVIIRLMK